LSKLFIFSFAGQPSITNSMKKLFTIILSVCAFQLFAQPCIPNTNSVQFDGFSAYVSISPQTGLDITTTLTIEAWIKPSAFGFTSAQNSIVCKHGWSSGEGGFVLRCGGSGELSFNIGGVDTNNVNVSWVEAASNLNALLLNTWTHVAATFDGYVLNCYINGNLAGSTPFRGTIAASTNYPLAIGQLADPVWGPDRFFSGSIDEVKVWNRALSQAEIQAGMNNHIDPTSVTGLVSYWRMNEGANATIYDVAGTNNGTMVNSTWDTSVPFNAVPPTPVVTSFGGILYSSATSGNQWWLGGTMLAGETQDSLIPLQNGVYTVEVTSPEGCSTMSAQFTVTDVGVNEMAGFESVSVYPNPVPVNSTIEISSPNYSGIAGLSVTDFQGKKRCDIKNIPVSVAPVKINLDRITLCSGIYFYELKFADGKTKRGKLVVE